MLRRDVKAGQHSIMTDPMQTPVYKILSADDYHTAQELGYTKTALDEGDGYVHLSTREQVGETLRLHYKNAKGVHLFEYIAEHFSGDLRWEPSRGGQLFPHLYSTLRLNAAKRHWLLETDTDGIPMLPGDIDG